MRYIIFIILLVTPFFMGAQSSSNIEASVNFGFPSFQTDYGERGDFKSNVTGNIGIAVSTAIYIKFYNKDPMQSPAPPSWMQKHTKLKIEASYQTAKLEHFGTHVEGNSTSANKLKKMHGRSSLLNLGTIFEYHPFALPDFVPGTKRKYSPYIGLGVLAGYSMPTLTSDLGDWENNPSVLIEAYQGEEAINIDPELTFSAGFGGGVRYDLNNGGSIILDYRWQYFNSDYIDGLLPDPEIVDNRSNDWVSYINIGYVFTFGDPLKPTTW